MASAALLPYRLGRQYRFRKAVGGGLGLAIACLVSYWLITTILTHVYSVSSSDELLGGMWAVVAPAFVYRSSYHQSVRAALSRVAATAVSFLLCLVYLLVFRSVRGLWRCWSVPGPSP
jgi:hypothetical protein